MASARGALAQFEPGPEAERSPPSHHAEWVSGLKVMLAEPTLQGEMLRAGAIAEAELAGPSPSAPAPT